MRTLSSSMIPKRNALLWFSVQVNGDNAQKLFEAALFCCSVEWKRDEMMAIQTLGRAPAEHENIIWERA